MKKRDAVHLISRQGFVKKKKKKKVISVQKQQQLKGDLLRMGLLRAGESERSGAGERLLLDFRKRSSVAAVYYNSPTYVT